MSDPDQWRDAQNLSRGAVDTGSADSGLLWLFVAVAVLGVIVLVGSLGGGITFVGSTGAEPVITPAEPEARGTGATGAEKTGTNAE